MRITEVECLVLQNTEIQPEACSSAQDNVIVRIHTDDGLTGIGEADINPWAAKALIDAPGTHCMGLGLAEMLVGEDPCQPIALWEKLYRGSAMNTRRGLGICAIGALDMALWDLWGKATQQPVWKLLGGAVHDTLTQYASLLPEGDTLGDYVSSLVDKAQQAVEFGFRAIKAEVCVNGPYSHMGLQASNAAVIETVGAVREAIGDQVALMVDVAYAWDDVYEAAAVMRELEKYDLFFLETPLAADDLEGHARLVEQTPIRIASGEWLTTRFEFVDLVAAGVQVVQPDVGRVGGVTEARRVMEHARDHGRLVVPHCWKTGIGIAASAHLCAIAVNAPDLEFLPRELSDSPLRQVLLSEELELIDGRLPLPQAPGLGVTLDEEAVERFRVA